MSREIRWVVTAEGSLRDVVARLGGDEDAIREGRVFVAKTRVFDESHLLEVGDEVIVAPRVTTADNALVVLNKSGDLIAVAKPAGIPTIPDHAGAAHSLLARVAEQLGRSVTSIHPTSRLDREVSGVVVFALTSRGREIVAAARESHRYMRRYVALADVSRPLPHAGRWAASIGRAKNPRHRAVDGRDATAAITDYRVVATAGRIALLAIAPMTGRTHQIRLHASHAGAPLLGDRVYGGPARIVDATGRIHPFARIGLHAARVEIANGTKQFSASAEIPAELRDAWVFAGGDDGAWIAAITSDV